MADRHNITVDLKGVASSPNWEGMTASKVLSLYGQQEYWIDHAGKEHRIREMPTSYLWTVLDFVRRNAPRHLYNAAFAMIPRGPVASIFEEQWARADWEWAQWETQPWTSPVARAICAELASRAEHEGVFPRIHVFTQKQIKEVRRSGQI